jgi:hypothetical protein
MTKRVKRKLDAALKARIAFWCRAPLAPDHPRRWQAADWVCSPACAEAFGAAEGVWLAHCLRAEPFPPLREDRPHG